MGVVGAIRWRSPPAAQDRVGTWGSGQHWCAGIDRLRRWVPAGDARTGSPGTPGCGSTRPSEDCGPAHHDGGGRTEGYVNGAARCAGIVGCCLGRWARRAGGGGCSVGRVDVFSRSGRMCSVGAMCPGGECVQFLAECVQFRGECVHFGGRCVQFLAGRAGWGWGADGRRDSSAPLRCARNDRSGGGEPGPGMAGAGNDVNAGNAISACVAGSAGKAGLSGVLRHLCKVRVESRVLA